MYHRLKSLFQLLSLLFLARVASQSHYTLRELLHHPKNPCTSRLLLAFPFNFLENMAHDLYVRVIDLELGEGMCDVFPTCRSRISRPRARHEGSISDISEGQVNKMLIGQLVRFSTIKKKKKNKKNIYIYIYYIKLFGITKLLLSCPN